MGLAIFVETARVRWLTKLLIHYADPAEKAIFPFIEGRIYQNPTWLPAQVQRIVIECSRHGSHQRSMSIGDARLGYKVRIIAFSYKISYFKQRLELRIIYTIRDSRISAYEQRMCFVNLVFYLTRYVILEDVINHTKYTNEIINIWDICVNYWAT